MINGIKVQGGWNGVHCENSDPLISKCIIKECAGAGAYIRDSTPTAEYSRVEYNSLEGIYCDNSVIYATDSLVRNNGSHGIGGGTNCSDLYIANCAISYNAGSGVRLYADRTGSLVMTNCVVQDNQQRGLDSDGHLTVTNCLIKNTRHGIFSYYSPSLQIINNWIVCNGDGNGAAYGIYLQVPPPGAIIRNNTISQNYTGGIYRYYGAQPQVLNCIIWDNGNYNLAGTPAFTDVTYCCINNPPAGHRNISSNPSFIDPDVGNFHIAPTSTCVDGGTGDYFTETDIDGEPRKFDGNCSGGAQVDIGGDEYYASPADFGGDGIVNFVDYAALAGSWLTTDANVNLTETTDIDTADLAIFAEEWLWESKLNTIPFEDFGQGGMMAMMGGEGEGMMLEIEAMAMESYVEPTAPDPNTVAEVLNWLAEMWLTGQLPEDLSEETYLDFRQAVEALAD